VHVAVLDPDLHFHGRNRKTAKRAKQSLLRCVPRVCGDPPFAFKTNTRLPLPPLQDMEAVRTGSGLLVSHDPFSPHGAFDRYPSDALRSHLVTAAHPHQSSVFSCQVPAPASCQPGE
jgi:hypothetical protein